MLVELLPVNWIQQRPYKQTDLVKMKVTVAGGLWRLAASDVCARRITVSPAQLLTIMRSLPVSLSVKQTSGQFGGKEHIPLMIPHIIPYLRYFPLHL